MATPAATNVGPLTTIFTPPANCLATFTSATGSISVPSYSLFVNHWGSYSPGGTCYPDTTTALDFDGHFYYSPGICPHGWSMACPFTGTSFALSVTASLCCPSGFDCVNTWPFVCQSTLAGSPINPVAVVTANTPFTGSDALTTVTPAAGDFVWGNGIPIAWESTDSAVLKLLTTGSQSPATRRPSAATGPTSSLPGVVNASPQPAQPTKSSKPDAVALGVGLGVGLPILICLVVIAALLAFRRREKSRKMTTELHEQNGHPSLQGPWVKAELDSTVVSELPLHGETTRSELEGEPLMK